MSSAPFDSSDLLIVYFQHQRFRSLLRACADNGLELCRYDLSPRVVVVIFLISFCSPVAVGVYLRRNWHALRQASSLDLQFVSRIAVFGVYVFLSLV